MTLEIYEVGVRDGLQNSSFHITTEEKKYMVESLYNAGLKQMEIASFVNPKLVPQMADAKEIFEATKHLDDFDVLIPNKKGLQNAQEVGAKNFNVFFSVSNSFNLRNLNKNLDEIYSELHSMLEDINKENIRVYISCAFGCPIENKPKEKDLVNAIEKASMLGKEVVLCDTIGVAHPTQILQTLELTRKADCEIALHLHQNKEIKRDIFSNVKAAVDWGVDKFDSSIAGLGGCPFIPKSGSNLSTNKLIQWAYDNNYETNIELEDLNEVTAWVQNKRGY